MLVRCEKCGVHYDDADRWTICPHGPLWAGVDAYCRQHDLVHCTLDHEYVVVLPDQPVVEEVILEDEPIHNMFGLSYGNYLVVQRSVMQSMPVRWQKEFVALVDEFREATADLDNLPYEFRVKAVGPNGKFVHDPYKDYERGRRRVPLE